MSNNTRPPKPLSPSFNITLVALSSVVCTVYVATKRRYLRPCCMQGQAYGQAYGQGFFIGEEDR